MTGEEQVRLRPYAADDLALWDRVESDAEVLGEYQWNGFADPLKQRNRWAEDGFLGHSPYRLVIEADGEAAGSVSWHEVHPSRQWPPQSWQIGVWVLPEHRGRGVGTTAQRLLIDYLFAHTPMHRIEAVTETGNVSERRALERCGFTREGTMRGVVFRRGEWQDCEIYGLLH